MENEGADDEENEVDEEGNIDDEVGESIKEEENEDENYTDIDAKGWAKKKVPFWKHKESSPFSWNFS